MAGIVRFEDLIAWQKAQGVAVDIYTIFKTCPDWDFRSQIYRAVDPISNSIAEGFNRKSRNEFSHFFYIALASASEVKSMIYLANRLQFISLQQQNGLLDSVTNVLKIITGPIKTVER